jgi:small subunit ribosomal protein S1
MSWTKRINHPSELVSTGDQVEVQVLNINKEKQEISLGMKQVQPNPWDRVAERYPPGTVITGNVLNLTNYGAFVEIEEGIDGLVHVSDMSWTRRIKHPSEVLKKGDDVEAIITSVDQENRRISLSIKEFQPNDWQTFKDKHKPGDVVSGVVTRVADFGVFVQIEGLVEGLMHVSETPLARGQKPQDHYKEGDPVQTRILRIEDAEMKVGLSGLSVEPAAAEAAPTPEPAAPPAEPEAPPAAESAAPETPAPAPAKKKRTRKKPDEAAAKE